VLRIDSDNPEIARELEALAALVAGHGGRLHESLTVEVRGSDLRVTSTLPPAVSDTVLSVPRACLPDLAASELYLAGDDICIRRHGEGVPNSRARALEHMLAVYNLTGKIAQHRAQSPWFALNDQPEIVAKLAAGRRGAPKVQQFYQQWKSVDGEALLLRSFLNTRDFGARAEAGQSGTTSVLMPFVDYLNHHAGAMGFQGAGSGEDYAVGARHWRPDDGTAECFVRYSRLDALDAFLIYNFPDESGLLLRSVPLAVDLGGGQRLEVGARISGGAKGQVPAKMQDLRPLLPAVGQPEPGRLVVSHLFVPDDRRPRALRRILGGLLRTLMPEASPAELQDQVLRVEQAVLEANRRYYTELAELVARARGQGAAAAILSAVDRLIALQLAKLDSYESRPGS